MLDFYGSMLFIFVTTNKLLLTHQLFTNKMHLISPRGRILIIRTFTISIFGKQRVQFSKFESESEGLLFKFVSMLTSNHKMTSAWLKESHNVERLWESVMMRHSSVVLSGCLRARRLCSPWLGHSGLSLQWGMPQEPTALRHLHSYTESLSAASRLIRCRDCSPVRLRLTARWNGRANRKTTAWVKINPHHTGAVCWLPAPRPWMSEITIYSAIRGQLC